MRRNRSPVKRVDGLLLLCHEHLASALVELVEIAQTPSRSDGVFHRPPKAFDVIVTTHKTIDLVCHTQVYKQKRDMTRKHSVAASSVAFMQNEVMEVNDEIPVHSPATDCGRPAPVGAPSQGAQDHSGTPGGP
jgi:hypothetical protein